MATNYITTDGSPGVDAVDLTVAIVGVPPTQIQTDAGIFHLGGVSHELLSNEVFTLTPQSVVQSITASLVLDGSTVELVVDEVLHDGVDESFVFDDSSYEYLAPLWMITVPADATDFSGLDLTVFRVIAQ
jgi:hypothetical protein